MAVLIGDKRLVIGIVINVLLQVGGILLNVGCQICEHALRAVDVGLGQFCHNSIGQIAADNTLVNLRVNVSCLFGAGDVVNVDSGAFLGNIIPLQFLDPVHVGRAHKHGVGVVPIAGRFRRGGSGSTVVEAEPPPQPVRSVPTIAVASTAAPIRFASFICVFLLINGFLFIITIRFQRLAAKRTAYSIAFFKLSSLALPVPAWSKAVP